MPSILVVDDSPTMLRLVTGMLVALGYPSIQTAANGAQALQILRAGQTAATICDFDMAPVNGLQVLSASRSDPRIPGAPFILMLPQGQPQIAATALQMGANGVLVKPFDAGTLRAKLAAVGR